MIKVSDTEGARLVEVLEETLDVSKAKAFREQCEESFGGHKRVILDLGKVLFMDSSAMGTIIILRRFMLAEEGELYLSNLQKQVKDLFRLSNLDNVFSIYASSDEALLSKD